MSTRRRFPRGAAPLAATGLVLVLSAVGLAAEGSSSSPSAVSTTTTLPPPVSTTTSTAPTTSSSVATTTSLPVARRPALGIYAGGGDVAGALQYVRLLHGQVRSAFDFLDDASWETISAPLWTLERWSRSRLPITFAVPLLPRHGATLRAGAAGRYDWAFVRLAHLLVRHGESRATLLLGWSPLERGLPWSVASTPEAVRYDVFFRRVVSAMRAVPGSSFRFAFEPGPVSGTPVVSPRVLFPGRSYVSELASSLFDTLAARHVHENERWRRILSLPFGPSFVARLAARLRLPLVLDGLALATRATGGGGDDPRFVRDALAWASSVGVRSVVLWDVGPVALNPWRAPRSFAALRSAVSG